MRILDELEGLVSSQWGVIKAGLSLTKLEAKLAGLSVYPLLINWCLLLVCLTSVWLSAMGLLGYGLMWASDNVLVAIAGVFLFNILAFGILLQYLFFNLKKMSFEKTRAYLSAQSFKGGKSNERQTNGDEGDSRTGNQAMDRTEGA